MTGRPAGEPSPSLGTRRFLELLSRLDKTDDIIVIGGQALAAWASFYEGELGDVPPVTTSDVDFQSTDRHRIEEIADALGGKVYYPSAEDATPEFAKVVVPDDGDEYVEIDFLPSPLGLDARQVAEHSELSSVPADGAILDVRFMHPVHCLRGTAENYFSLRKYRTPWTLGRLRTAIAVVAQWTRTLIEESEGTEDEEEAESLRRDARWTIEQVGRLARHPYGAELYVEHGIDVLEAVPEEASELGDDFADKRLPQITAQAEKRRQKTRNRLESRGFGDRVKR